MDELGEEVGGRWGRGGGKKTGRQEEGGRGGGGWEGGEGGESGRKEAEAVKKDIEEVEIKE